MNTALSYFGWILIYMMNHAFLYAIITEGLKSLNVFSQQMDAIMWRRYNLHSLQKSLLQKAITSFTFYNLSSKTIEPYLLPPKVHLLKRYNLNYFQQSLPQKYITPFYLPQKICSSKRYDHPKTSNRQFSFQKDVSILKRHVVPTTSNTKSFLQKEVPLPKFNADSVELCHQSKSIWLKVRIIQWILVI